ncbi:MAG: UDP-N-acetylmuramate--L-alanine ligase [Clostridium sp.]
MMFNLYEDKNKKVHFIGIGGISMSGLAEVLLYNGYTVSGSDRAGSNLTDKLERLGATIYIGHDSSNINDCDLVVYTAAISEDNPELMRAHELKIDLMDRADFLGSIMKDYSRGIAVSGTHGKTTVTSMVSTVLLHAKLDPTIMVGGVLDLINGNVKVGNSEYFVTEACEYKRSFLKFNPNIGIILNIDADHLDYYKDITEIEDTFVDFTKLIPDSGLLIGCADDSRVEAVLSKANCPKILYGIEKGDIIASNIEYNSQGLPSFDVHHTGEYIGKFSLSVPGRHNVLNSLSVIGLSLFLGIDIEVIREGLTLFHGTHRRFQKKGIKNGIEVIDDYAHHPAEIKATIQAVKNYPHKKVYCIFQPHTYTRTITLFDEFASAFDGLDNLILTDIYAAREKDTGIVSSKMLSDAVKKNGVNCTYIKDFDDILSHIKGELKEGDLLVTMGAGDVYIIGEQFLN